MAEGVLTGSMNFNVGDMMNLANEVVPDQIAGIDIPNIDPEAIGQLVNMAEGVLTGDFSQMFDKALKIREVLLNGTRSAGDCWGVVDCAVDVMRKIQQHMEPLFPLLTLSPS